MQPWRREPLVATGQQIADPAQNAPESKITLPWVSDPEVSWLDYRCWIECDLDPGMALHKPLPQANPAPDSLASTFIDSTDFATSANGVNVASQSQATDFAQRMATSTYRFLLRGYGIRAGFQIPIPGLKTIAGQPAIPDVPQRGYNVIVGNMAGIPLWYATWELAYFVTLPLGQKAVAPVAPNPALHINPDAELPLAIFLPATPDNAANIGGGIIGGGGTASQNIIGGE